MADEEKNQGQGAPDQIKALRTFESDAAEVLQQQNTSSVQIAVAEQERPRESREKTVIEAQPEEHPRQTLVLLTGLLILVVAGALVWIAYLFLKPKSLPPVPTTQIGQPIVGIDLEKTIEVTGLTKKKIIDAIKTERDTATLKVNSTESIRFTERTGNETPIELSAADFMGKISPSLSATLRRSLEKNFAFGIFGFDGNQPFIILRTTSYENAYNGMLKNEIDLYREAGDIFVRGNGPLPSLSSSSLAYFGTDPENQIFRDAVVNNTDTRLVKNERGEAVFIYGFPDQNTIIITTNVKVFGQILEKIKRTKLVR